MTKWATTLTILFVFLVQFFYWQHTTLMDRAMWGAQAEYVWEGDARAFDAGHAYGHPGGPIVLGTIALAAPGIFSYDSALIIFLSLAVAGIVAGIFITTLKLRKNMYWSASVVGLLSAHPLYLDATAPSIVAGLLVVLLSLVTVYTHEQSKKIPLFIVWGLISGILIATRVDIGVFSATAFGLLLLLRHGVGAMFIAGVTAFATFFIMNPFMWFMPFQHLLDIISKITYHYAAFVPTELSVGTILSISFLSLISMALIGWNEVIEKVPLLPRAYLILLLLLTCLLYVIFLTSTYQAIRYFIPVILIWEILLPFYVLSMLHQSNNSFLSTVSPMMRRSVYCTVTALFFIYPLTFYIY